MPATLDSQVAELIKQGASQQEAIETVVKTVNALKTKLDEPVFPGRPHAGEGTLGYWDTDGKPEVIKTHVRADGKYRPLDRKSVV